MVRSLTHFGAAVLAALAAWIVVIALTPSIPSAWTTAWFLFAVAGPLVVLVLVWSTLRRTRA